MIKKIIILLLSALLLGDIGFSFIQHYNTPFDGDMSGGIVPNHDVIPILDNPLGINIFTENTTYPNPNRFFSHWTFYHYFNTLPIYLQNFASPIDSAYLSCAIAKTIVQISIIFLLSFLISGRIFRFDFLLSAFLITPLFQTNGYSTYMGIIDPSTTYTFFYAMPIILVILYFMPLYFKYINGVEFKAMKYLKYLWIPLALISSLSGPLNPGISLVVSLLVFIFFYFKTYKNLEIKNRYTKLILLIKRIPKDVLFYLIPICVFSLYSLLLGRYNSLNVGNEMPLWDLYLRLPIGIYYLLTQKLGFPILVLILAINSLIIRYKINTPEGKTILKLFKWIGLFALIYILLLPFGGYRDYRPNILRYDTILPITISLVFIFAKTTIFILRHYPIKQKYWYTPLIILVLFIFTNADKAKFDKNDCERKSIQRIAESKEKIVRIDNNCKLLSWEIINNPKDSELNTKLLKKWRIIKEDKLYYQSSSNTNKTD